MKKYPLKTPFLWLLSEGIIKIFRKISKELALFASFRWLPIREMFAVWRMKIICEFYWAGVSFWHSRRLPIEGCYKKIETVPLGVTHPCESCIEMRFFLTYRALKVAGNYRPGRRKMGFNLWFEGAMPSGFSHKYLMLAKLSFALSKHRFCH